MLPMRWVHSRDAEQKDGMIVEGETNREEEEQEN